MSEKPILYSIVNANNELIFSNVTINPNYPVKEGQRLVKDIPPEYNTETEYLVRDDIVPTDSDRVLYTIHPIVYPEEYYNMSALSKRNGDLRESDWTQLPDVALTETQVNSWREYRQKLRDLPTQPGFPKNVTWPTKPE
jgi:hypothetical protein